MCPRKQLLWIQWKISQKIIDCSLGAIQSLEISDVQECIRSQIIWIIWCLNSNSSFMNPLITERLCALSLCKYWKLFFVFTYDWISSTLFFWNLRPYFEVSRKITRYQVLDHGRFKDDCFIVFNCTKKEILEFFDIGKKCHEP